MLQVCWGFLALWWSDFSFDQENDYWWQRMHSHLSASWDGVLYHLVSLSRLFHLPPSEVQFYLVPLDNRESGFRRKVIHSTCCTFIHIIMEYLLWQHWPHLICKFERNNWMLFLSAVLSPGVNLLEETWILLSHMHHTGPFQLSLSKIDD